MIKNEKPKLENKSINHLYNVKYFPPFIQGILLVLSLSNTLNACQKQIQQQPIYLFSHGLGGNKKQAYYYQQEDIIRTPLVTFDYPDVLPNGYNPKEVNLGQEQDVATFKKAFDALQKTEKSPVLFGVSRGAATIVNFLGKYPTSPVSAIILESPFDHVASIVKFKYYISALHSLVPTLLFEKYDCNGMQPITSAPLLPTHIPILLICSEEDDLIPCSGTVALYQALKNTGNPDVYLLKLKKGVHANILWGTEGEIYQNVVHAFYKKYGLPYNPHRAELGAPTLAISRP